MSTAQSQDVPPVEVDHGIVARVITKGSCPTLSRATIAGNPFGDELHADISNQYIYELLQRQAMLNISIIQLWMLYLNHKIEDLNYGDLYGYLEPQSIQKSGNKKAESQNYINERIQNSPKQIYFAPYVDQNHWQLLVLCPAKNVVWFYSLHRKPNVQIKKLIKR
uniref:Ubiquitin-like protease family profile domain-containing protein n=1 Tax=Cajanus cajan TaxID=3821 RepID=A0A151QPE8_CAJCA|nr:hypothetical protein KK1_047184 [Cajanus cajan]